MKKSLLILLVLIMLSGCTVTRLDDYDYKQMLDKIISLDIKTYNMVGKGYKYYVPKGVTRTSSSNYNDVLKRNGNTYYLYVDVVSYYYKTKLEYNIRDNVYYSKKISNGNKDGFVDIEEKNDKLYIQMVYNYAKIETYVDEHNLKEAIADISYVLSSIDFNDSLLKKMYEEGTFDSKEEVYKLFENKEKEGNFLEYIKEYDKYEADEEETEQEIIIEEITTTTKNETTDVQEDKTSSDD